MSQRKALEDQLQGYRHSSATAFWSFPITVITLPRVPAKPTSEYKVPRAETKARDLSVMADYTHYAIVQSSDSSAILQNERLLGEFPPRCWQSGFQSAAACLTVLNLLFAPKYQFDGYFLSAFKCVGQ